MLRIIILLKPTWQAQKGNEKEGGPFPHLLTMQTNVIFIVFKRLRLFLFGRGPNRVIETACFDAKVQ